MVDPSLTHRLIHSHSLTHSSPHSLTNSLNYSLTLHSTITLFLILVAAAIPVSVFPAPQGSTTMPERARPLPNIFDRHFSW